MAEDLEKLTKFIEENKGKRKFKQTVELAINFKGIDFSKQDNKINLEVTLPHGKGKSIKIAVFANDNNVANEAKQNNMEVINGSEIEAIAKDPKRLNGLLEYELIAQPQLMPTIAKSLGQFLGPRNKMPKPLIGSTLKTMSNDLTNRITLKTKGKNIPTVHCVVGTEDMNVNEIYDNIKEIVNSINRKLGGNHIKSLYVKFTMSEPLRFI